MKQLIKKRDWRRNNGADVKNAETLHAPDVIMSLSGSLSSQTSVNTCSIENSLMDHSSVCKQSM